MKEFKIYARPDFKDEFYVGKVMAHHVEQVYYGGKNNYVFRIKDMLGYAFSCPCEGFKVVNQEGKEYKKESLEARVTELEDDIKALSNVYIVMRKNINKINDLLGSELLKENAKALNELINNK